VEIERSASGGELFELNLASDVGADVFHRVGGVYGRGELLVVPFDVWYSFPIYNLVLWQCNCNYWGLGLWFWQ
jgi:hypothetical protein